MHYNFDTYFKLSYRKGVPIYSPNNSVNTQNLTFTKLIVYMYIIGREYKFSKCWMSQLLALSTNFIYFKKYAEGLYDTMNKNILERSLFE